MKNFKKVVCMLLAVVMLLALAACGGSKNAADTELTEIKVWSNNSHSKEVMTKLVESFNSTTGMEKGIKIVYEIKEGDVGKETELALASGTAADICYVPSRANKARDGLIVALEDFEGGAELVEKYKEAFPQMIGNVDGKTYTLPFSATTRCLIYNKDMFKAAGLVDENGNATPPKTWDEVREYAKKLTNVEKKQYGIVFPMKWSTWPVSDIISPAFSSTKIFNGYDVTTGEYDFTSYEPVLETIMGIKNDGSYFPGAENLDNDAARAYFAQGNIGMKFGFSWDIGVFNTQFPATCDWGIAEYPLIDADGERYKSIMSTNSLFSITSKSVEDKGKEKVFEVFKWLHSDEVITELYKNCCDFPVMQSMLLDDKVENPLKGWTEMAELVDRSVAQPTVMPVDITGKKTFNQLITDHIWVGSMTIKDALKEANRIYNEGVAKHRELQPDLVEENKNRLINPDYNPIVK